MHSTKHGSHLLPKRYRDLGKHTQAIGSCLRIAEWLPRKHITTKEQKTKQKLGKGGFFLKHNSFYYFYPH